MAAIGFGVTLTGGSTVAEITSLECGGRKCDFVDVTAADSDSAYRQKLPTILDAGQITVEANYTSALAAAFLTLMKAKTISAWTVTFPGSTGTWNCSGFVTSFDVKNDVEGKQSASITIELTGVPT
jgi:hypothetical protein